LEQERRGSRQGADAETTVRLVKPSAIPCKTALNFLSLNLYVIGIEVTITHFRGGLLWL
jgi:hypothetical protein